MGVSSGRRAAATLLVLILTGALGLARSDEAEFRVKELEVEIQRLTKSAQEHLTEKEILNSKISTLESKLKEVESLTGSRQKELETKEAAVTQLKAQADAAERRALDAQTEVKQLQDELQKGLNDAKAASEKLQSAEAALEKERSIVSELEKELPPLSTQSGAQAGATKGQLLVERVKQAVKHQADLAKEAEQLRESLAAAEKRLQSVEGEKSKLTKSSSEVARLHQRIQELESEAQRQKEALAEVAKQWFPAWLSEALQEAQDKALHHWEHKAVPTIKLVRSQSLDAYESARKQAEPHVQKFIQSSRELAQSTRETLRPHLEVAKERHAEAVTWLSAQTADLKKAAEPHLKKAQEALNEGLAKVQEAASPYVKQASEVVTPYYEEVYAAAKPGLEAMQATAAQYWRSASQALGPQLELLAEQSKVYQRQVSGMVGNVTQQVKGVGTSPDALLFAEVGAYLVVALGAILAVFGLLRVCFSSGKGKDGKKAKSKAAAPHAKKHHHSSHSHHTSGSHSHQHKKHHK